MAADRQEHTLEGTASEQRSLASGPAGGIHGCPVLQETPVVRRGRPPEHPPSEQGGKGRDKTSEGLLALCLNGNGRNTACHARIQNTCVHVQCMTARAAAEGARERTCQVRTRGGKRQTRPRTQKIGYLTRQTIQPTRGMPHLLGRERPCHTAPNRRRAPEGRNEPQAASRRRGHWHPRPAIGRMGSRPPRRQGPGSDVLGSLRVH